MHGSWKDEKWWKAWRWMWKWWYHHIHIHTHTALCNQTTFPFTLLEIENTERDWQQRKKRKLNQKHDKDRERERGESGICHDSWDPAKSLNPIVRCLHLLTICLFPSLKLLEITGNHYTTALHFITSLSLSFTSTRQPCRFLYLPLFSLLFFVSLLPSF